MKIRNGFVSNSSSSSFVLSTSKTDEQIYQDIQDFYTHYNEYQKYLRGENFQGELVVPSLEEIKENVEVFRADEKGNISDRFVYSWYTEDHNQPEDFFKGKVVVYGEDNFLPNELEDFYFLRSLYSGDYRWHDGCTHMG